MKFFETNLKKFGKFSNFFKKIQIFGNFFEKKRGHLTMFLMAKNRSLFWTETPGKLPILCAHFGETCGTSKNDPKIEHF